MCLYGIKVTASLHCISSGGHGVMVFISFLPNALPGDGILSPTGRFPLHLRGTCSSIEVHLLHTHSYSHRCMHMVPLCLFFWGKVCEYFHIQYFKSLAIRLSVWLSVRPSVMDVMHFPYVALSVRVFWALQWRCHTSALCFHVRWILMSSYLVGCGVSCADFWWG